MNLQIGNLFSHAEPPASGEHLKTLLRHRNLGIERIVSSSAVGVSEYVQAQDEWVVLLRGKATLRIASETVELRAGDHVFLSAGVRHAVERVSDGALWLAVHLYPEHAPESGS